MKTHLIYGVILGLVLIVFHFVRYLIDPMWVLGGHLLALLVINLSVNSLFAVFSINAWKRQSGNVASYGTALKYVFVVLFTANLVSSSYESIFNYANISDLGIENEDSIKAMIKERKAWPYLLGYRLAGASEEEMQRAREELTLDDSDKADIEKEYQELYLKRSHAKDYFMSILAGPFFLLPLAMLLALFLRSRKPGPELTPDQPAPE